MKILVQGMNLANELSAFDTNIKLHIVFTLNYVPKMLQLFNPGQWSGIQHYRSNMEAITHLSGEDDTLCL